MKRKHQKRLRAERDRISKLIDLGFNQLLPMDELCAAKRALDWAISPKNHARPGDITIKRRAALQAVK